MAIATMAEPRERRFATGQLVMTREVHDLIEQGRLDAACYIARHLKGDWGDVNDRDWQANDTALKRGDDRLFSSYDVAPDLTLWIITEWDRSATTLMLPSDY